MLKDFVDDNKDLWSGKNIFVIATMGLFSGDGAGILARRLRQYGAQIQGGLHLKMPDSIADQTQHYTNKLKINAQKCIGCGKCAAQCPMNNIQMAEKTAKASNQCTMCYRCINICPQQAITLIGKSVIQQGTIEKYL